MFTNFVVLMAHNRLKLVSHIMSSGIIYHFFLYIELEILDYFKKYCFDNENKRQIRQDFQRKLKLHESTYKRQESERCLMPYNIAS